MSPEFASNVCQVLTFWMVCALFGFKLGEVFRAYFK